MDWFRLRHTLGLYLQKNGFKRADYIKNHSLFHHVGKGCMFMFRKLPLYSDLISVGDNVHLASNVCFITHDVAHSMLNYSSPTKKWQEFAGCIEIGDNVFVGANTTILYNSRIPSNTIIGANSFVNKILTKEGVYAGTPVKYICSLDEFVSKRDNFKLQIHKNKTRLSEETIEEAWKLFREKTDKAGV